MKIGLILAISLFILFPAFISAEFQCHSTRWSIRLGDPQGFYSEIGDGVGCNDTCVQFKCIVEDDVIIMGGGCYRNYEDICRYVPTVLKEKIKRNMKNIGYTDSSLIFTSKSTGWGGSNEYPRLIELNPSAETTFAAHLKTRWDGKEIVQISDYNKPRNNKLFVGCGIKQSCKPGSRFDKFDVIEYAKTKNSPACVSYMCTVDGKKIMSGSGSFDEFDRACGNVADSDKKVVKDNIKNSFHYGSNFVVASCSHDDNCSDLELRRYIDINKEAYEKFHKNVDKSYDGECDYQPLTMEEEETYLLNSDNSKVRNVASSIDSKLYGLISFGLILIYLW